MLMKKSLRLFFLGLMAMVSFNAMAEDIIWSEDWSGATEYTSDFKKDPAGFNTNYTFAGTVLNDDGKTVKSGTKFYGENLAGGTAPELLIAKKGGSFTANVALGGRSGDMMLTFKTNRADLTLEVTGASIKGEKERVGNNDTYTLTVQSGKTSIQITFKNSSSSNARLDDIKLYQGDAKKPAGLSWGKASTSVTLNGDYANIPTLQNANNLPVTCTSSDEGVCTVTNEGVITVVGDGKTTITAEFAGNDEYEAQSVSIEVTVNPAIDDDARGQKNDPYLISDEDFLSLVSELNNSESKPKSGTIYVKGFITNVDEVSTEHGNATFKIAATADKDAEIKIVVYRAKYLKKEGFTSEDQIKFGDEVVICGQIQWYYSEEKTEPQFIQGAYIYSLNGITDGISSIKTAQKDGVIYDLTGRRVEKAVKGINIINGKKVIK